MSTRDANKGTNRPSSAPWVHWRVTGPTLRTKLCPQQTVDPRAVELHFVLPSTFSSVVVRSSASRWRFLPSRYMRGCQNITRAQPLTPAGVDPLAYLKKVKHQIRTGLQVWREHCYEARRFQVRRKTNLSKKTRELCRAVTSQEL